MDGFLDFLGLYRSDVAKDATCMYRAVAEQLFYTQSHHVHLKQLCIEYCQRHRCLFEPMLDDDFDCYLQRLSDNEVWAGPMEMTALSLMYRIDFILYRHVGEPPIKATNFGSNKQVVLAEFSGNRFDCVYTKSYLAASAICQSITYEVLYKEVFGYGDDIHIAVEKMLHDKQYSKQRKNNLSQSKLRSTSESSETGELEQEPCSDIKKALAQGIPPFPYKVAKTLDPNIYRNVEFDIWNEEKKETLRSEQYVIPTLAEGVKCKVTLSDNGKIRLCTGYVQELHDDGQITVYIEELCKRCAVVEDKIEIVPVPAYKALTWHGGKTYRVNYEDRKTDFEQRHKNKFWQKSGVDSQWIPPPVDAEIALGLKNAQDTYREQIDKSSEQTVPQSGKGQFRQYSSSFSTPKTRKQGYQKPRSSRSMTSYKDFCTSLRNVIDSEANENHSSPFSAAISIQYVNHLNQGLMDSSSSCSSGYQSSTSQNAAGETPEHNYMPILNHAPAEISQEQQQQCFLQLQSGCLDPRAMTYAIAPSQECVQVNSVGSATATSLPLQIPLSSSLKQVVEDGGYQTAPFSVMSPQVALVPCSLCHPYILYGSDGQQVPFNVWSVQAQNGIPSAPGVPSVLVNTPPSGMSPPAVTQVFTNYMQTAVPQYSTSWTPAVHQNFLSGPPPTVFNEVPYSTAMLTPPWSPQSSVILSTQQRAVHCPVPNAMPHPSLVNDQPRSIQSV